VFDGRLEAFGLRENVVSGRTGERCLTEGGWSSACR
jgi:hypothetical protein